MPRMSGYRYRPLPGATVWQASGTGGSQRAGPDWWHRMQYGKQENCRYLLVDIRLNLESVQPQDIHRTNIDINLFYR
jgi:hypothetical protein